RDPGDGRASQRSVGQLARPFGYCPLLGVLARWKDAGIAERRHDSRPLLISQTSSSLPRSRRPAAGGFLGSCRVIRHTSSRPWNPYNSLQFLLSLARQRLVTRIVGRPLGLAWQLL